MRCAGASAWLKIFLAAGGAGGVGLAADLWLARSFSGVATYLEPRHVGVYVLCALGAGLSASLARRSVSSDLPGPRFAFAWGLMGVYAPALAERAWFVLRPRGAAALALALASLLAGAVFALAVSRLCRAPAAGPQLVAVLAAVILALNRHLPGHGLETGALLASGALLAGWCGLVWLVRRRLRRPLLLTAGLALLGLAVLPWSLRPAAPRSDGGLEQPNLLLIAVDTLRYDTFRTVLEQTPEGARLRRVLGEGATYGSVIAASSWTAPSMGSIFTGLEPRRHGLVTAGAPDLWTYRRLAPDATTLAERLSAAGYHSEAWVTNAMLNEGSGIHRGFARYRLLRGPSLVLPLSAAWTRAGWLPQDLYPSGAFLRRRWQRGIEALGERRPFFAWLHFMDPHMPWRPHPELPETAAEEGLDPESSAYLREVRHAALEIARAIEALDHSGLGASTWIVLVSDHGEMLPVDRPFDPDERMHRGHGQALYEPLVHVPLVLRPPFGVPAGFLARPIDRPMRHVDLAPLLESLLGLADAGPAVEDAATDYALLGTYHRDFPQRGLRGAGWKLVEWLETDRVELYDLRRDAEERENLAGEHPELVRELHQRLERRWRDSAAPPTADVPLDEETRRQLEALGYVD